MKLPTRVTTMIKTRKNPVRNQSWLPSGKNERRRKIYRHKNPLNGCAPYLIRMLHNAQTNVRTFGNYSCWSFKNICVVCQLEAENFCCSLQMGSYSAGHHKLIFIRSQSSIRGIQYPSIHSPTQLFAPKSIKQYSQNILLFNIWYCVSTVCILYLGS